MYASDTPLLRRIAPSVLLRIELPIEGGGADIREFKLCFDINAAASIKERTGVNILNFQEAWPRIGDPCLLRVMLWAAVLAHHPEYDTRNEDDKPTDEGIVTIGSWIDESNGNLIIDALWDAYLKSLSKGKREVLIKLREESEKKEKAEKAGAPSPPVPPSESVGQSAMTAAVTNTTTATTGSSSGQSPATSALDSKNSAA